MVTSPLSSTKNKLIFGACLAAWSFAHFIVLRDWGLRWQPVIIDTIATNLLLLVTCLTISNTLRYYRPRKNSYLYVLVLCIVLSGLWAGIVRFGLTALMSYDAAYVSFLNKSMPVRFDIALLIHGCMALMSILWYNLEEQKENDQRKVDAEKLSKDAELYKLRQQMQPHFLFNSLNSISALVVSQPEQARKMIQQLSDFLRGTLKKEEHQPIELKEELQYLQLYLDIEKVRFGHRLTTEVSSGESTGAMVLPPMLLQPLVENAIKFGLYDTTEDVTIRISAEKEDGHLVIIIQNPFDPETSVPRQGTGFGLNSVQRRLYLLFARNDLLTTSAENNIFTIAIKIPQA